MIKSHQGISRLTVTNGCLSQWLYTRICCLLNYSFFRSHTYQYFQNQPSCCDRGFARRSTVVSKIQIDIQKRSYNSKGLNQVHCCFSRPGSRFSWIWRYRFTEESKKPEVLIKLWPRSPWSLIMSKHPIHTHTHSSHDPVALISKALAHRDPFKG